MPPIVRVFLTQASPARARECCDQDDPCDVCLDEREIFEAGNPQRELRHGISHPWLNPQQVRLQPGELQRFNRPAPPPLRGPTGNIPAGAIAEVPMIVITPPDPPRPFVRAERDARAMRDDMFADTGPVYQSGNRIEIDDVDFLAFSLDVTYETALEYCRECFEKYYDLAPTVSDGTQYQGNVWQTMFVFVRYNFALNAVEWRPHDIEAVSAQLDDIIAKTGLPEFDLEEFIDWSFSSG